MKNFLLTQEERQLVLDAGWIYRKNSVILKVMELFGQLQAQLAEHSLTRTFAFPEGCLQRGGKISRGERYKELPWVMLDYPRYFTQEDMFAFRTMFWWGHYFSCTLHLAGRIKVQHSPALQEGYVHLAAGGFYAYLPEDPWEHDFENGNYKAVETFAPQEWEEFVQQRAFIKLARPFALKIWEKVIPEAVKCYATLLTVISA